MDENLVHVDRRPIGSGRHSPDDWRHLVPPGLLRARRDPGTFAACLLSLGIAFALIGAARLAWNVYEEGTNIVFFYDQCSFCGFQGFWILDKSMPYFAAFGLFVLAAGVWRGRA